MGGSVWRGLFAVAVCGLLLAPAAAQQGPAADGFARAQDEKTYYRRVMMGEALKVLGQTLISTGDAIANGSNESLLPAFEREGRGGSGLGWYIVQKGVGDGSTLLATVSGADGRPVPLWPFPVASAPLFVFAAIWLRRRTFPSVQLSGRLYDVAAARGPAPPLLQPLLRLVAMVGLSAALVATRWLDPLLLASTLLLLGSLAFTLRHPAVALWAEGFAGRLLRHRSIALLAAALSGVPGRRWVTTGAMGLASAVLVLALAGVLGDENKLPLTAAALLILSLLTLWEVLPRRSAGGVDWESVLGRTLGLTVVQLSARPAAAPGSGRTSPLSGSFDTAVPRLALGAPDALSLLPGGHDPEDRREYVSGDDLRAVDWRATARTGKMMTKLSAPETEASLWLFVDCSASTQSGLHGEKRDHIARLVSLLARSASMGDDRFGLALFTTGLEMVLPPHAGRGQSARVAAALAAHAPREPGTDLPRALEGLGRHIRGPSTILLVSDFTEEPPAEFAKAVKALRSRGQKVMAVRVVDPLDTTLPDLGVACIENPETGAAKLVNTSDPGLHRAYRAAARDLEAELRRALGELGVPLIEVRTTEPPRKLLERMARIPSPAARAS